MTNVGQAIRALRAAPLVSALAVASIGLGIGAVATVYSTASAFTFKPLPQLTRPDHLVVVAESITGERSHAAAQDECRRARPAWWCSATAFGSDGSAVIPPLWDGPSGSTARRGTSRA